MFFLDFSPVAFSFGHISIYWYGIIYATSILLSWKFACYIIRKTPNAPSIPEFDVFMFAGIIACVVGARLGHILFFEFEYYLQHPLDIMMIRNGGLSFHGAVIGIISVVVWFSRKYKYNFKVMADILAFAGSIGIFCGRIANFINQELYGSPTGVKWAVIFSRVDSLPRHPTQIYESIFEGLFSFWIMLILWKLRGVRSIGTGVYAFIFLTIYSSSRYIIEFFKDVEVITYFNMFSITVGQILSIVFFLLAICVLKYRSKSDV